MRNIICHSLVLGCAVSAWVLPVHSALARAAAPIEPIVPASTALTLKRVTLSSSGLGYFEYEAQVESDATLALPVKLSQVNDVLKSLVVYDAKGQVGGVSLPGREPLAELLSQLPFDAAALSSMPTLLQALRGAMLQVQTDSGAMEGRIMAIDVLTQRSDKGLDKGIEVQRHRASLMTATGLRQFVVEEAKAIQFQDEALRKQIASALTAMSDNRAKDGRTVEIITRGNQARTVRVGFVASAPIWKTAYRLTVPATDAAVGSKSQLQGWAVIENLSGQDWRGVELTLTSGKPVAFQQNLYESVFNQRPTVAIEMPGRIVPRADAGTVLASTYQPAPEVRALAEVASAPAFAASPRARPVPAPAAAPMAAPSSAWTQDKAKEFEPVLAQAASVPSSQDQGTQMSYRFPMPVSVGNGRSLSVPIIMQELGGQRVAQYQPQLSAQFPLAALELANTTANGLPPGAVTVYEQSAQGASFLGDAQLAVLPAGASRMLAFALDQKISITSSVRSSHTNTRASIERATLVVERMQRQVHSFSIKSNHGSDHSVVVDVPNHVGYTLLAPTGKALGQTAGDGQGRQRVSLPAPAGSAHAHEVVLEQPQPQRLPLESLNAYQLAEYARVAKDEQSTATLRRLIDWRQNIEAQAQRISQADEVINQQHAEQARLRENLSTVSKGSELYRRYSKSLDEAESSIVLALKTRDEARGQRHAAEQQVKAFLAQL